MHRVGRPRKASDERWSARITVQVKSAQASWYRELAARRNVSLPTLIREALDLYQAGRK